MTQHINNGQEIMVKAIENGTVLDHIPINVAGDIVEVLGLHGIQTPWIIGSNFPSKKTTGGIKAFIKVVDHYFEPGKLDLVSLFAPDATINIIENFQSKKFQVKIPERVEKLIACANPGCITNKAGEPFETSFSVSNNASLLCKYCEKITTRIRLR
jgi:aspartate carbamoyltransferase regulatory subunit